MAKIINSCFNLGAVCLLFILTLQSARDEPGVTASCGCPNIKSDGDSVVCVHDGGQPLTANTVVCPKEMSCFITQVKTVHGNGQVSVNLVQGCKLDKGHKPGCKTVGNHEICDVICAKGPCKTHTMVTQNTPTHTGQASTVTIQGHDKAIDLRAQEELQCYECSYPLTEGESTTCLDNPEQSDTVTCPLEESCYTKQINTTNGDVGILRGCMKKGSRENGCKKLGAREICYEFCETDRCNIHYANIQSTTPTVSVTTPTVSVTTPTVSVTTPTVSVTTPTVSVTTPTVSVTTPTVSVTTPTVSVTSPAKTSTTEKRKVLNCYSCTYPLAADDSRLCLDNPEEAAIAACTPDKSCYTKEKKTRGEDGNVRMDLKRNCMKKGSRENGCKPVGNNIQICYIFCDTDRCNTHNMDDIDKTTPSTVTPIDTSTVTTPDDTGNGGQCCLTNRLSLLLSVVIMLYIH